MTAVHDLPLFVLSGILLNLTPGPDTLYVATRSALGGWRAGSAAALGVACGCFAHILAAAFGLSALMASSAWAFGVVKYVGAAYLVWTGLSMLRARGSGGETRTATTRRVPDGAGFGRVFLQGLLTNALNPKVALFFLAFLPQFVDAGASDAAMSFLFLGLVFNCTGTAWNLTLAAATARLADRLRRGLPGGGLSARLGRWATRLAGALFVGLGVRLAGEDLLQTP